MSTSRLSLITILENEFKNLQIKEQACESAKQELKKSPNSSRIFDKFPCLIPQETLLLLTNQFQAILSKINIDETSDGFNLIRPEDKENISKWEKDIASIAIDELFDKEGNIKNELIELLGWQHYKKQLSLSELTCSIACGFVGSVNQVVMKNSKKTINEYLNAYFAICNYVNPNYRNWVMEKLDAKGFIITAAPAKKPVRTKYDDILLWPIENPKPGIFIVLAGVATAATVMFAKKLILNRKIEATTESKVLSSSLKYPR